MSGKFDRIALRVARRFVGEELAELPYVGMIEKIKTKDGKEISVWNVDGHYVRDNIDPEFTNFAHHLYKDYIPEDQFWIDQEATPNEYDFYVANMMANYNLMKNGATFAQAIAESDKIERELRRKQGDLAEVRDPRTKDLDPKRVHKRLWKVLENGIKVWIVNGRLVRSAFDIDFVEGGHEHVYFFVPEGEIWIDDDLMPTERGFVALRELHEHRLMGEEGIPYSKAHADSSRIESHCRKNPDELQDYLTAEGW